MFYLLLQGRPRGRNASRIQEELLCFEADSHDDAVERAVWFGVDFSEGDVHNRTWNWHSFSLDKATPMVWNSPLDQGDYNNWIIVYKNGNMKCEQSQQMLADEAFMEDHLSNI